MGREPLRHPPLIASAAEPLQCAEHLRHFGRRVVGRGHVAEAKFVSLCLVVAAELEEEQPHSLTGEIAELREARLHNDCCDDTDLRQLCLRQLVDRVLRGDMANLVTKH